MELPPRNAVTWVFPTGLDVRDANADQDHRNGCPWHDVLALLRQAKLRPTRQRMALGWLLFAKAIGT